MALRSRRSNSRPELVIYTDDPKRFADEADLIKILARDLRKRIVVGPPSLKILKRLIQKLNPLCRTLQV